MSARLSFRLVFALAALFSFSNSVIAKPEKLAVEYFSELPDINRVRLSPSGEKLASMFGLILRKQKVALFRWLI